MTLLVNLFGAPSSGKSTMCSALFGDLKKRGYSVEMAPEVPKVMVHEGQTKALTCQPYVTSCQLWSIMRIMDQHQVVLTDSPILLGTIYGRMHTNQLFPDSFYEFLMDQHLRMPALDVLIRRTHPFETIGRVHSEEESNVIHFALVGLLAQAQLRDPSRDHLLVTQDDHDVVLEAILARLAAAKPGENDG